jgi:hypothetical protein
MLEIQSVMVFSTPLVNYRPSKLLHNKKKQTKKLKMGMAFNASFIVQMLQYSIFAISDTIRNKK